MSLTLRLALTYLLLTLCGFLLLGAGFLTLTGRYLAEQGERELAVQAQVAAVLLGELASRPDELQALNTGGLIERMVSIGTTVRIFSSAGVLISGPASLGPFPSRPALAFVSSPLPLIASQASGRRYAAQPIAGDSERLGVIELSRSTADEQSLLAALRDMTLRAALIASLAMALISWLVARSIGRPVLRLAARAEAMAADLDGVRKTVDGPEPPTLHRPPSTILPHNELATLARSLDTLDERLRAYTQRIGELEQNRARFLRNISHELRTPLTAIRGTVENLRDMDSPTQRLALMTIEEEAARLTRLVDALLSQPAQGAPLLKRRPVDLVPLVGELYSLQQGRARRAGVELQRSAEVPALVVMGDRDQLKQVLLNLLDNALRNTPPGGHVRTYLSADEGWAELRVADSGPGVPPALREQIWQRGVRGVDLGIAGAEGGAGLGLAIVREIVAAHGGSAALTDSARQGAEFVIRLPIGS